MGYNPQERTLTATITQKQLAGYNNFEYVTFWVDWNNDGIFSTNEYVGISSIFVADLPAGSLLPVNYAVSINAPTPLNLNLTIPTRRARATLQFGSPTLTFGADPTLNINSIIQGFP